jgi:CheY-like chemotaxis protein
MPAITDGCERVLVVEDDDAVRQFATEVLTELGYQVVQAGTGDDALGILARERNGIDVVFCDIVMPGRATGVELAHVMMSIRPALPVVLTSGYADGAWNLFALPRPVRFLRKPYHVYELAQAIREALGEGRA